MRRRTRSLLYWETKEQGINTVHSISTHSTVDEIDGESAPEAVWTRGMGLWLGPTILGPIPAVIIALMLGFIVIPVQSQCQVDQCWLRYNEAQEGIADGRMIIPSDGDATCIPVRTYYQCIKNMTRACFGDINFHSILKVVETRLKFNNCTKQGLVFEATTPSVSVQVKPSPSDMCKYKGKAKYKHCGLFGDPHLRTFSGHHQTCRVKGAWSLIDNEHLLIQVTNDPVGQFGLGGTAASRLTVVIRSNQACASEHFLTYQATTDYLPTTFVNGLSAYGPDNSVRIEVKEPGRRVAIHIGYISTTIILSQVGRYFTFAIKMPEEVIRESKTLPFVRQLCVKGCPRKERINYRKVLAQKRHRLKGSMHQKQLAMSREEAEKLCHESQVIDFYFDSCVFDLMTTGDTNFTLAAHEAWKDMLGLLPEVEETTQYESLLNGSAQSKHAFLNVSTLPTWTAFLLLLYNICTVVRFQTHSR